MKVSSPLKGGIYEVSFGYNPNLGGYMVLMSDMPKLYAISPLIIEPISISKEVINHA